MGIPADYEDRVYAGVLGKIIGVYVGRPVEQWSHQAIMERVGPVNYYCHEQLGKQLVVPDDDISGTFTFLRALPDHGNTLDLTPGQVGETWLNYIIERRTILWWGGMGASTEHTAFLRLKAGVAPPASGSAETNCRVVAEQIGAQIFTDGWGMVSPGDPEQAADLARRAACVSHDGEAIHGAQVVAALVAQAFVERDTSRLLDTAVAQVPADCTIARVVADVRKWREKDDDWLATRQRMDDVYGYAKYGGGCHIVPNHAVIILALTYAGDDFQRALMIGTTAGWDTDCNVGNIGCIMGVKLGLEGINAGPDWRGPVADRLYLPSADGGRVVTDAVREADEVVRIGRALAGEPAEPPKDRARCHFERPGSVQGFVPEDSPECRGVAAVENVAGHSEQGERSLAVHYRGVAPGRSARVATATFLSPDRLQTHGGYGLMASPALCPGQTVRARVRLADDASGPVECSLYVRFYGAEDRLAMLRGETVELAPGAAHVFQWRAQAPQGRPVAEVGVEVASAARADGTLYLDWLDWSGAPEVLLAPPDGDGVAWQRAWVDAVDRAGCGSAPEVYRLVQNRGRGLLIQGTREWAGYQATVEVNAHMADAVGLAVHVQGLRRYYALLLRRGGRAELVRFLGGEETVLASVELDWQLDETHTLSLSALDGMLTGTINGATELAAEDAALTSGAVALVCEGGRAQFGAVAVAAC